ncbi:MAG: DciA family protein [Actinobacteria bacterium]|nr:DciA family protein [Actinomycetota bacterium]
MAGPDDTRPDGGEHDPQGLDVARRIARAARGAAPKPASRKKPTGRRPDDPTPLGDLLKEVIAEEGWTREVSVHQLLARWPALVGPVNAAHSVPEGYADTVLTVRAESSTWATSLRTMAPQLVAVLNEQLGQGTVTRVVVLGPEAPTWKKGRRSVPGRGPRDTYG